MRKKEINIIVKAAKQEIKNLFKDSAAVITYIVMTLLVCILYSYIYSHEVLTKVPIVVVDQDQTSMSRSLKRMMDASPQVEVAYTTPDLQSAQKLYEDEKVRGIILIPNSFSSDIQKGIISSVSVYADASYIMYYKQLFTVVNTVVGTFRAQIELKNIMSGGIPQKQAMISRRPVEAVIHPLFNINGGYGTFLMPVVFLIALQTLQLSAMGLIGGTQRENNQLKGDYKFATPLSGVFFVIGRSVIYTCISLSMLIFLIGVVLAWFGFPQRGNAGSIVLFLIPFVLSVTFLGISLMNLFRHREDALMTIAVFSIPTLFLCGVSWPFQNFPEWIKNISYLIPTTLGVKGFLEISQFGASLKEIQSTWYQMWGISLLYFIVSVFLTLRIFHKKS